MDRSWKWCWPGPVAAGGIIVVAAARSNAFFWGDDYAHLLISKAVPEDARLVLSVWGRPIMTLAYMPAAQLGDVAVRLTSLAMAAAAAWLLFDTVRRRRRGPAALVPMFLLGQTLPAVLAFSALPGTVFSLLLAAALWLDTREHPVAAAVTVSLLPLARLEGVVVIGVWAAVLVARRLFRALPFVCVGVACWAAAAAAAFRDPLAIIHMSPYGGLTSLYPRTPFSFALLAFSLAAGSVIGGVAVARLGLKHAPDRLTVLAGGIAGSLICFYGVIWRIGAFQALPHPVYLVPMSVPIAILAYDVIEVLLAGRWRPWLPGEIVALAIAAYSRSERLLGVVVVVLVSARLVRTRERWRQAVVVLVVGATLLNAAREVKPLRRGGAVARAYDATEFLGARAAAVVATNDPVFLWRNRNRITEYQDLADSEDPARDRVFLNVPIKGFDGHLHRQPAGALVVWADAYSAQTGVRPRFAQLGYAVIWSAGHGKERLAIWQRGSSL